MDRAERVGLGIAAVGHVALLAVLSLGLVNRPRPLPLADSMDVQLTDAVGLRSTAPVVATEPPAPSEAPETGAPEDAAPPAAEPDPAPTPPPPAPVPPRPAPPAPAPAPSPKPAPKPTPPKPAPAPARERLSPDLLKGVQAAARAEGRQGAAAAKPKGARLGNDFLKGIVASGEGRGAAPRAEVGAAAMNGLGAAIKRQVQPCYERKPLVGPGADRIRTVLRLRFNPDGSLSTRPTLSEQSGVDDENGRYAKRAAEVAIAAVMECTPLKLPADLYKGGWEDIEPTFSQRPGQ
ncbi:MAG: hypothetical protein PGN09_08495 [Sphingomonas fennica]